MDKTLIRVCMGSSCYARGNNKIINAINKYLSQNNLTEYCNIKGTLCECDCGNGPNMHINDKKYNEISVNGINEILDFHFKGVKNE